MQPHHTPYFKEGWPKDWITTSQWFTKCCWGRGNEELTIIEILQKIFLAREVQLHFNVYNKCCDLPRFQRKLGECIFQLPTQEVSIQLLCIKISKYFMSIITVIRIFNFITVVQSINWFLIFCLNFKIFNIRHQKRS